MEILLDVNSDQRDPYKWPLPQDYSVNLNRPLYNVTNIKLEAAKIPISQTLINEGNNTFSMNHNNVPIKLENRNYTNGTDLALNIENALLNNLADSHVDNVHYSSNTDTFTFSNTSGTSFGFDFYDGINGFNTIDPFGTPSTILGMSHQNTYSVNSNIHTGAINLYPPTSIIIRVTTNDNGDDLSKDVFINNGLFNIGNSTNMSNVELNKTESVYFGRILTYDSYQGNKYLIYQGGYPIEDYFSKGPEASITKLRFRFYYTIGGKLIPYDFRLKNHTLKFKITCNLDKLNVMSKQLPVIKELQEAEALPEPIELPQMEYPRQSKKHKLFISLIVLLIGLYFLIFFKKNI